jgi:hypothetical protein
MSFLQDLINKIESPLFVTRVAGYNLLPFNKKFDILSLTNQTDGSTDQTDCLSTDVNIRHIFVKADGQIRSFDLERITFDEGSSVYEKKSWVPFCEYEDALDLHFNANLQTGVVEATVTGEPKNIQLVGFTVDGERVNHNRRPHR